jgi:hypothetical protein
MAAAGYDNNGVFVGKTTFNNNALTKYVDNSNSPIIIPGSIQESNSTGGVKYGRASGGTYNGQPMLMTTWIAGTATSFSAISDLSLKGKTGSYTVQNSTAPYIVSGGAVTAVGTPNSVTGNMSINFGTYKYSYRLNVPASGLTFNLANSNASLIPGNAKFSDNAGTCYPSCSGLLYNGALIEGSLFGSKANTIGLQYGINAGTNNIYGAAVLK